MITILTDKIESLSQKNYDKFLESINFSTITCSCGKYGSLTKHAYYSRKIKIPDGPVVIRILRVLCKCCGKTHALFPECIVPYSQMLLKDHIDIIKSYHEKISFEPIMMANEYIDESNIRYVIKQFLHHWKECITSFNISLYDAMVSSRCLKTFRRQFMQIKYIPNILSD